MSTGSALNFEALEANRNVKARNYWKSRLAGFAFSHYLEDGHVAGLSDGKPFQTYHIAASAQTHESLLGIAALPKAQQIVLLAALGVLVNKVSGCSDLAIFCSSGSGASSPDGRGHTIPVRMRSFSGVRFVDLLGTVKEDFIRDSNHGNYPLKKILNCAVSDLFSVGMEVLPMQQSGDAEGDGERFDILFSFDVADALSLTITYNTGRFSADYIRQLAGLYFPVLQRLITDRVKDLAGIEILPEQERQRLVYDLNATQVDYPSDETVLSLFGEQVKQHGGRIALTWGEGKTLRYDALNERADRIAAYLQEKAGVIAGSLVGVLLTCEENFVPLVLGILKTGAAYVPIDPSYPAERVNAIIADSQMKVLVTRGKYRDDSFGNTLTVVDLDQAFVEIEAQPVRPVSAPVTGSSLAYVIYTSGSTGKPKGVMIEHGSLVHYVRWAVGYYINHEDAVFALFTSIAFDLTVTSIFTPLISGHTIKLYEAESPTALVEKVFSDNVATVVKLTPSHLKIVRDSSAAVVSASKLKVLIVGGEDLETSLAASIYDKFSGQVSICNEYGPTEATVGCMIYRFVPGTPLLSVPIGEPIHNTQIYLLDSFLHPVPVGVPGEVYISGNGLARGYLNNEVLSKKSFIPNPYAEGSRMYKTGDLAVRQEDGAVLFKGRVDDQVKLRGFRVELGDVVSHLEAHAEVKEAVVLLKGDGDDKYLVGYYVSETGLDVADLREFLSHRLPEYAVPSRYARLERMPLTPNGKLDKKALPEPVESGDDYIAPSDEVEQKLVEIWAQVLKIAPEKIGVNSNFFALGGNSLKIVLMLNRVSKVLDVLLPINTLFNHQEIKSLALHIRERTRVAYAAIGKAAPKEYYTLSSAQKRLFFVYQFYKGSLAYNGVDVTILTGRLDVNRLVDAFQKLVARHESLRTSFQLVDHTPVQKVHDQVDVKIEYFNAGRDQVEAVLGDFVRAFDLATPPLFRVALIGIHPEEHVLVIDTHHIITDGMSQRILIKDLVALYSGDKLPELRLQYTDYAEWQQAGAQQEGLAKQRAFWLKEFAGDLETLNLPTDFSRPTFKGFEGSAVSFEIGAAVTRALTTIAEAEQATMFMVMLAMYNVLLAKLGNQQDVVIGTPVGGRQHADLENIVGMFVNTLALRNYPKGDLGFRAFLANVKASTLACFENQAYPYEELIENLGVPRDTSRNPLFDVMFVYQDFDKTLFEIPGLTLERYDSAQRASKFDLTLTVKKLSDTFEMSFEYSTDLFKAETVKGFVTCFETIIKSIVADDNQAISAIDVLSAEDKSKLLVEFNTTEVAYPKHETIVSVFERQVEKTPDRVAVRYGETVFTYRELHHEANAIASYLQGVQGVRGGDLVGLMLEREAYLIPCIFGILKAGGAYVPIDPKHPSARVKEIITGAALKVVITRKRYADAAIDAAVAVVDLDDALAVIHTRKPDLTDVIVKGSDLAYVIFTSGSTGVPKGVMIEHHSVINRILWMQKEYPITADDVLLQKTPIVFDVSVWEIFWWSFVGASLYLLEPGGEGDRNEIVKAIDTYKVTTIHFVPSMLNVFLSALDGDFNYRQLSSLRYVFSSGEALLPKHVDVFGATIYRNCHTRLINLYGPTEATVDVSFYECDFKEKTAVVPIGKPIDNTRLYVLDQEGGLLPVGVWGELYIAGVGLARGYLNNEPLTALKFVNDRFVAGERMYRTGDLARWRPDGTVEFSGRIDSQVKIRGFRIELGEIEYQLSRYDGIREAVVLVKGDEEKHLVAYYVSTEDVGEVDLRSFLSERLPGYMIPAYYVRLDEIPLTTNGKLDRKALPDPDLSGDMAVHGAMPINDTQKELLKIWSEVLAMEPDKISVNKNFFQIGGDSLKLIKLVDKVNQRFNVELTVAMMFKYPMISLLAKFLNHENDQGSGLESGQEQMNEAFKLFNQIR